MLGNPRQSYAWQGHLRLGLFALLLASFLALGNGAEAQVFAQSTSEETQTSGPSLSPWQSFTAYVQEQQRAFHKELAASLRRLKGEGSMAAGWTLILVSFLYGLFHAAGPGHGKAVISTYMLTHEDQVRRGLTLAALSSFLQGLVALGIVGLFVLIIGWSARASQVVATHLEKVSYGLIILLGLFLIFQALRGLASWWRASAAAELQGCHSDHDASCGHSHHIADVSALDKPLSLGMAASLVLSIGLRPCTGAILVLVLAESLSLRWAGVSAVLAMSAGTALAICLLALLAVKSRDLARQLAGGADSRYFALGVAGIGLVGGCFVAFLGLSLLEGAFSAQHPLF